MSRGGAVGYSGVRVSPWGIRPYVGYRIGHVSVGTSFKVGPYSRARGGQTAASGVEHCAKMGTGLVRQVLDRVARGRNRVSPRPRETLTGCISPISLLQSSV